jgi:hypothetical protein
MKLCTSNKVASTMHSKHTKHHLQCARPFENSISGLILVTICMPANADGLLPPWDKVGNISAQNGFPENSSIKNIPDGSIWALPHLFQSKFLNSSLI